MLYAKARFLRTTNIDLNSLFESQEIVKFNKRVSRRVNGKKSFFWETSTEKLSNLKRYIPYCYYIIDAIIRRADEEHGKYDFFTNLYSKCLDHHIGEVNRRVAVSILKSLGIVGVNVKRSTTHKFSMSYRIFTPYVGEGIEHDVLIGISNPLDSSYNYASGIENGTGTYNGNYDNSVNKQFKEKSTPISEGIEYGTGTSSEGNRSTSNPIFYPLHYLTKSLNSLSIDKEGMKEFLPLYRKLNYKNKRIQLQVEQLLSGVPMEMKIGFRTSRVVNTINQLPKPFRKFLRFNGQELIEVDFKTSHVCHLLKLIEDDLRKGVVLVDIDRSLLISEANEIRQLLAHGDFYEFLAAAYHKVKKRRGKYIREQAKKLVLVKWLHQTYRRHNDSKWIETRFPAITSYIKSQCEVAKGRVNSSAFSVRLMSSEASLLGRIISAYAEACPESVVCTIYDAILTDFKHVDQLHGIALIAAKDYLGFPVRIVKQGLEIDSKYYSMEAAELKTKKQVKRMKIDAMQQKIDNALRPVAEALGNDDLPDFWKQMENNLKSRVTNFSARE